MAFLRNVFLRNSDGTEEPGTEPTGDAYVAWKAKNMDSSVCKSAKYNMGQMHLYGKILKREGSFPIAP